MQRLCRVAEEFLKIHLNKFIKQAATVQLNKIEPPGESLHQRGLIQVQMLQGTFIRFVKSHQKLFTSRILVS